MWLINKTTGPKELRNTRESQLMHFPSAYDLIWKSKMIYFRIQYTLFNTADRIKWDMPYWKVYRNDTILINILNYQSYLKLKHNYDKIAVWDVQLLFGTWY